MLAAQSLLAKGYLPRELPPTFTTEPLAALFSANPSQLPIDKKWTECSRHNLARVGGFRRPLKVPNPRSYVPLAIALEQHWQAIKTHLSTQRFSISRPVVTRTAERAVRPRYKLGEAPKLRARYWRGQRYVLRTDVGQFYSSLYTHSIPWALHGKAHAKANMNKTVGDEIDKAMRHGSGGQTVGIPIGPDASFVVAEIVLSAVDAALVQQLNVLRGFRYLDDYELAFRSRAEADEALVSIEGALGEFELVINPFKTHVIELPHPVGLPWTHQIAQFPVRSNTSAQALTDVIGLFSHAASVARTHPGALKYALLRSRGIRVDGAMWRTFQSLVWSAVSSEPTTMPAALDLLAEKAIEAGSVVDKDGAREVVETLIATNAPLRNGSEVAWALWAAIQLGLVLPNDAAEKVSEMDDNFVALLALHAASVNVFGSNVLDTTGWETLIDYDEVLLGPHWLLAYEGLGQGWLSKSAARIAADPFFSVLAAAGVRFYDLHPTRAPFTGPAGPLPGSPVPDDYL